MVMCAHVQVKQNLHMCRLNSAKIRGDSSMDESAVKKKNVPAILLGVELIVAAYCLWSNEVKPKKRMRGWEYGWENDEKGEGRILKGNKVLTGGKGAHGTV